MKRFAGKMDTLSRRFGHLLEIALESATFLVIACVPDKIVTTIDILSFERVVALMMDELVYGHCVNGKWFWGLVAFTVLASSTTQNPGYASCFRLFE